MQYLLVSSESYFGEQQEGKQEKKIPDFWTLEMSLFAPKRTATVLMVHLCVGVNMILVSNTSSYFNTFIMMKI